MTNAQTNTLIVGGGLAAALVVGLLLYYWPRTELGPPLEEPATVVAKYFSPDTRDTTLMPTAEVDSNGNVTTGGHWVETGYAAQYRVAFRCQHGRFEVDRQDVYEQVSEREQVTVRYAEASSVYRSGKREFAGYKFLGVRK